MDLIFKQALTIGMFPSEKKKKKQYYTLLQKGDKQHLENYRPVPASYLWKTFLKDSYLMKCLVFLLANNLREPNQSGFKRGCSCINQLLPITHEIYSSFDDDLKLEVLSWIYLKPSIKFGMMGLHLNLTKTVSWMTR